MVYRVLRVVLAAILASRVEISSLIEKKQKVSDTPVPTTLLPVNDEPVKFSLNRVDEIFIPDMNEEPQLVSFQFPDGEIDQLAFRTAVPRIVCTDTTHKKIINEFLNSNTYSCARVMAQETALGSEEKIRKLTNTTYYDRLDNPIQPDMFLGLSSHITDEEGICVHNPDKADKKVCIPSLHSISFDPLPSSPTSKTATWDGTAEEVVAAMTLAKGDVSRVEKACNKLSKTAKDSPKECARKGIIAVNQFAHHLDKFANHARKEREEHPDKKKKYNYNVLFLQNLKNPIRIVKPESPSVNTTDSRHAF